MSIKSIVKKIIPSYNKNIYSLCKRYVDAFNNENNGNMNTNGELFHIRSILPKCKTVFDIGANVGDWTELALTIKSDLKVHCFEPSAETFNILKEKHFGNNVSINNLGMGSTKGTMELYIFEKGSGINSLYKRHGLEDGFNLASQSQTELVNLDTVDNYCRDRHIDSIDFIKIDVEGHELQVFKGATEMLGNGKIKYIQFEYGGCNIDSKVLLKDIFDFFAPYKFTFYKVYPQTLKQIDRYDQRLENFQYQNWMIIKR